jgi:hypothetical protein
MTMLAIDDFLCQDNTVGCPVAAGVDPSYLYFSGYARDNTGLYIYRVAKSLGMSIMDPANWQAYNAGVWDSVLTNATDQSAGLPTTTFSALISYHKDFGVFVAATTTFNTSVGAYATAPTPWGPWTYKGNETLLNYPTLGGFKTAVPGLCPMYDTSGMVACVSSNNGGAAQDLYLRYEVLGPRAQIWMW